MRISYWSSDVCSSDLAPHLEEAATLHLVVAGVERVHQVLHAAGGRPEGDGQGDGETDADGLRGLARDGRQLALGEVAHLARRRSEQVGDVAAHVGRSEEHTSELQSLMRISYAVFCLKKKTPTKVTQTTKHQTPRTV